MELMEELKTVSNLGSALCDKCIAIGAMARELKTARCSSLTSSQESIFHG